jgi:hypothetical protein
LKQSISAPAFSSRQLFVEAPDLISIKFPVAALRNIDERNGRPSRIDGRQQAACNRRRMSARRNKLVCSRCVTGW